MPYTDTYERAVTYLRVSVTDRCNLRCIYCMPKEGVPNIPHPKILRYEEIVRVVRVAVNMGMTHVRLTGGEPLVRKGIVDLVAQLSQIDGLLDLSMTTNGHLLARYAEPLAAAGLDRVNLSLDTLKPERYHQITRLGHLDAVFAGRKAALDAGLRPVKVNAVIVRGINDDEVVDLARLTRQPTWHLRFIEVMPLGKGVHWTGDGVVSSREIRARVEAELGPLTPVESTAHPGIGPARYYRLPEAEGTLGFISPVSDHFCQACNRLRLTSDGRLLPCLMSNRAVDLRDPLRAGVDDATLRRRIQEAIQAKPRAHPKAEDVRPDCHLPMSCVGG